ncbi:MAG: GGDEF domain-containing protein [Aquificaceae bacterium]
MNFFIKKLAREFLDRNPLTFLPGNRAIEEKITQLSSESFYVIYVDIDNFKAYNDAYGFLCGDNMIKKVGFTLNMIASRAQERIFVGHVGGDDFVIIVSNTSFEEIKLLTSEILVKLTRALAELYRPEDVQRGYFESLDRNGKPAKFPIAKASIVAVIGKANLLELSRKAATLKVHAKKLPKASAVIETVNGFLTITN